jgi:hypothetical protein
LLLHSRLNGSPCFPSYPAATGSPTHWETELSKVREGQHWGSRWVAVVQENVNFVDARPHATALERVFMLQ